MKKLLVILAVVMAAAGMASARENTMQGTLVSENSVQCGTQTKGKKSSDVMCQEYVIRTEATEYHVRQEKEAHKELLPVNAAVEFTISKDKMKFKVNGKSYEMLIVSETAAPAAVPKQ